MNMSDANDKHPALIRAQTYLRSANLLLDTRDHASAVFRSYSIQDISMSGADEMIEAAGHFVERMWGELGT